jgi:hypothetical protein
MWLLERDYNTMVDTQVSHTTWTVGKVYARGLEETAGYVKATKSEYRKVSQDSTVSHPPGKRLLGEITDGVEEGEIRYELNPNDGGHTFELCIEVLHNRSNHILRDLVYCLERLGFRFINCK